MQLIYDIPMKERENGYKKQSRQQKRYKGEKGYEKQSRQQKRYEGEHGYEKQSRQQKCYEGENGYEKQTRQQKREGRKEQVPKTKPNFGVLRLGKQKKTQNRKCF